MKKTIAALILAAMAATPALAQSYVQRPGMMAPNAARSMQSPAYGAYAYDAAPMPGVVFQSGMYAGSDPDVNVRMQLQQQADTNFNR